MIAEVSIHVGRSDGSASVRKAVETSVGERRRISDRRITGRVAEGIVLTRVREHTPSAANRGTPFTRYIPGESEPRTVCKSRPLRQTFGIAVHSTDSHAVGRIAGTRDKLPDERSDRKCACKRIDGNAFSGGIASRPVKRGRIRRVIQRRIERRRKMILLMNRRQMIEAHSEIQHQAAGNSPVVLHEPFRIPEALACQVASRALFGITAEIAKQSVGIAVSAVERVVCVTGEIELSAKDASRRSLRKLCSRARPALKECFPAILLMLDLKL